MKSNQTMVNNSSAIQENDQQITLIDLLQLFKRWLNSIRKEKYTIYVTVLIFLVLGLISSFTRTMLYTTTHKVMSYNLSERNTPMSQLQRLGGLFGQLPATQSSVISGQLMISLLETYPVTHSIASRDLRFHKYRPMTFFEYSSDHYPIPVTNRIRRYTIGLPGLLFGFLNRTPEITFSDSIAQSTNSTSDELTNSPKPFFNPPMTELVALQRLKKAITIQVNDNIIEIQSTMPDPLASYDLALIATEVLMQETLNMEVRRTQEKLQYIQDQFNVSLERFQDAQLSLAEFRDQNKSIVSEKARIQLQQLQSEYNLAFQLHSASSAQLEEAKIKLREDTPLFSVLDPAKVPLKPKNTPATLYIALFLVIGLLVSLTLATFKAYRITLLNFYKSL